MGKYERISEEIGERSGWDFAGVNSESDVSEAPYDYVDTVKEYLSGEEYLLDLGTGGGEVLISLSGMVDRSWGIDLDDEMIQTARRNLGRSGRDNVEFLVADSESLPFQDELFDVVICRQAPFCPDEVQRVLKNGCVFVTQQVRENDKINIKRAFERGQSYGRGLDELYIDSLKKLEASGFTVLRTEKFDVTTYLESVKDLIKLLKWSPIIPDFDVARRKDRKSLEIIERKYGTSKGIRTNTSRFLLIARNAKS